MLFKSNLEYQWMLMWVQKSKKKKEKKKMCAKKVIFGILLHVAVKIVDMKIEALLTIPWLRVI